MPQCPNKIVFSDWYMNHYVQGRTPLDVSDPDVETLLEELKKQQELVSKAFSTLLSKSVAAYVRKCKVKSKVK